MKKFASLLLTVALLAAMFTVFAVPASAETDIIEKQEGATWLVDEGDDHVWYKLTENGTVVPSYIAGISRDIAGLTLTIGGTGAMPDFETSYYRPWDNTAKAITTIQILSGVTSIGNFAFLSCYNLTSVTIPVGVTSIGTNTFNRCESLTSVTIPVGVTSIGDSAFNFCSKLTSVTIPVGVTSIGDGAFHSCSSLTSVTIPASVTSIGGGAFSECSSLTSVTIPASVTIIGYSAFKSCESLTSVTVKASTPPTLESDNTFDNTPELVIYVPYGTSDDYKSADNWESAEISEKIREAYIIDNKCTESGTVTADKDCFPVSDFAEGQTVTVTVVPSEGHQLKKGCLLIEYRENGDRKFITPTQDETDPMKYSFIMPAANVIATVCEHDFGNDHICTKCGEKDCVFGLADHTWDAATGKCTVCEYVCPHDGNTCVECGANIHGGEIVQNLGSVLSEGSLAIIVGIVALVIGLGGGFFLGRKKKRPAQE